MVCTNELKSENEWEITYDDKRGSRNAKLQDEALRAGGELPAWKNLSESSTLTFIGSEAALEERRKLKTTFETGAKQKR